jgi:signal transduction histidine kinase
MKRLIPQSVNGRVLLALFLVVTLINLASLAFYVVFRDEAAVAASAAQAADQIIVIKRMIDRTPREDQVALMRRFTSPVMSLAITRSRPIVSESDNQLPSRVVLKRLKAEFPKGTDIRVDSRIELGTFQGEAAAIDAETREPFNYRSAGGSNAGQASGGNQSAAAAAAPKAPVRDNQPPLLTEEPNRSGPVIRAWQRFFASREEPRILADNGEELPRIDEALFRVSVQVVKQGDLLIDGNRSRNDYWLNARVLLNIGEPPGQYLAFLWLTAISVVVGLVAFWGVRRATVPLSVFATAAERLGVDVNVEPISEEGPSEVKRAAHAFNTMQRRLQRFIQDRTQMLAAISHDLRTPITRLRLRAEFIDDDDQRGKMLSDLNDMEAMISSTLAFARDDAANEPATHVDAAAIVAALCGDQAAAGRDVRYNGPDSFDLVVRPLAFKRAIDNFVDNAVKYGKQARVTLIPGGAEATIYIDDDGPGISASDMERVFAPFIRLERSRSRETGGTGLGMTIARNAIRSMGGDVELTNRPDGGLRVKIMLPVARAELLAAAE